jgi:RHH-type transcriptional regulator, rel operon repressor / antitoxin RelB
MNVDTSITARVSNSTKNMLDSISKETQRSRSFHIQKALELYINDYADLQISLDRLNNPADTNISADELINRLNA